MTEVPFAPPPVALAIRSQFDGSIIGFIGIKLGTLLFTLCTLGLGLPWSMVWWEKWQTKHTIINGYRLKFTGTGAGLIWRWIKLELLCIITCGIYGLWAWRYIKRWKVEHTVFAY